jgi:putative ABC transport system permease protein
VLSLALRNLRARPARTLLTAIAVALGVAMIFAMRVVGVTTETAAANARALALNGADLEVTGASTAPLNGEIAARVAADPRVAVAGPIYDDYARIPLERDSLGRLSTWRWVRVLGVDPARLPLAPHILEGATFSAPDAREALMPSSLAAELNRTVSADLPLLFGTQVVTYTVRGLVSADPGPDPLAADTVWLPLATLQTAYDTPNIATSILVRLQPGANPTTVRDAVQKMLGPLYVVTSAAGAATQTRAYLAILTDMALPIASLVMILTGAFLVSNAFAITLAERRREIGQLRVLGMTRRQVFRQTLFEALLVALLGGGLGLPLGLGLGRNLTATLAGALQGQDPPPVVVPPDAPFLAIGVGVLVTVGVVARLARRASQVSPLEALFGDSGGEGTNWYMRRGPLVALGVLVLCGVLTGVAVWAAESGAAAFDIGLLVPLGVVLATILALPLGVRLALALFVRLAGRGGATVRLAARSLARQQTRAILTAATLTLGLMTLVALAGITRISSDFFRDTVIGLFRSDFTVVRSTSNGSFESMAALPSAGPIPTDLQADLDALAVDAEVRRLASVHLPGLGVLPALDNALALDLSIVRDNPDFPVAEGTWDEAARRFAAGPALTLPALAARRAHVHPGDSVPVTTQEGIVPFTVALVGGSFPVMMPETAIRYFNSYPSIFLVDVRPGHDRQVVALRLQHIDEQYPGVYIRKDLQDFLNFNLNAAVNIILGLFGGLTALSGIVGALAVVNTLLAAILERQREIGMLRTLGMVRRQVRRMVMIEAGLLGLTGAALGTGGGLAVAGAFGLGVRALIDATTGRAPGAIALPWEVGGLALASGPLLAVFAALFPAARAAGVHPAQAMREDGGLGLLRSRARATSPGRWRFLARRAPALRLALSSGAIFLVLAGALVWTQAQQSRDAAETRLTTALLYHLNYMTSEAHAQIAPAMFVNAETAAQLRQEADAQQFLFKGLFGSLSYYLVTDTSHRVLYSSPPDYTGLVLNGAPTIADKWPRERRTAWSGAPVYEAEVPLAAGTGAPSGYLIVGVPAHLVDDVPAQMIAAALQPVALAVLATMALTYALARRLTRGGSSVE